MQEFSVVRLDHLEEVVSKLSQQFLKLEDRNQVAYNFESKTDLIIRSTTQ